MASKPDRAAFDPATWLAALVDIGGGYALASGGKLWFVVDQCDADDLAPVMSQIVGSAERQAAVKETIELRSLGRVS